MKEKLKILHLEDMPDDALLVSEVLKKGLIDAEISDGAIGIHVMMY